MNRLREIQEKLYYWWCGNSIWVSDLLTILLPVLFFALIAFCMNSCGSYQQVPVFVLEKVEYKDSLIYVHDTVKIDVPYEKVVEVLPDIDTSYLETSVAKSTAYLDSTSRKLHHTLEQNGKVECIYDTIVKVQYVDRLIEKEVPIVKEVEVAKYDTFFWVLLGWTVFTILIIILRLCIKPQTLIR